MYARESTSDRFVGRTGVGLMSRAARVSSPVLCIVAKGRNTAPRSTDAALVCRLGNVCRVPRAEKGEPNPAGTFCADVDAETDDEELAMGKVAELVKPWVQWGASKSSCKFVRGTKRLSRRLESVELNSMRWPVDLSFSSLGDGSVQKSGPRLGRLMRRGSNMECADLRFCELCRLWSNFKGEPRLRRKPTV